MDESPSPAPRLIEALAQNVERRMEEAGLNRRQLAKAAKVDASLVGRIICGQGNPTLAIIEKLAAALDCAPLQLLKAAPAPRSRDRFIRRTGPIRPRPPSSG